MQKAQLGFAAVMVAEMSIFLFKPEIFMDIVPELAVPHGTGYRMIALATFGLMIMYVAAALANDYMFAAVTCAGRLASVPFCLAMIFLFKAPHQILLGVIPDVLGAVVTIYFVQKEWPYAPKLNLDEEESKPELLTRLFLALAGGCDIMEGALMVADPINYSENPIVANPYLLKRPTLIGMRSYGFTLAMLGAYQLSAMAGRSSTKLYIACGVYHILFAVTFYFLGTIVNDPQLSHEINHPLYHVPLGLLVAGLAANIPKPSGVNSETVKEESKKNK